jgi:hypothetical protein
MRQPQISYQGYLEPVTRLINCHFVDSYLPCMYVCYGYEQLTCSYSKCFQQQLGTLGNLKSLAVYVYCNWLIRPIYFSMKLIVYDS